MSVPRDEERGTRLLTFWEPPEGAGEPLGCIATTYTFDGAFFEEHCLGRFAGIETAPDESARAYLIEREEKLSQLDAFVLVDRAHVTALRSLRWNLLPVTVSRGGILHAKVAVLTWRRHVRVLVGSANLTEPGYRRNHEHMASFDFTEQGDLPRELLFDVLDFLARAAQLTPGTSTGGQGPRQRLERLLAQVRRQVNGWPDGSWARGSVHAVFLPVAPGRPSLFDQIRDRAWGGRAPHDIRVLSPFFDLGPGAHSMIDALAGLSVSARGSTLELHARGRKRPDGRIEYEVPEVFRDRAGEWERCEFHYLDELPSATAAARRRSEAGESRPLHAKSLQLYGGANADRALITVGSSNFTRAGFGLPGGVVNIEANVAYVATSSVGNREWGAFRDIWPETVAIDDLEKVDFRADAPTETEDASGFDRLPDGLGSAIYEVGPQGARLLLHAEQRPGESPTVEADGVRLVEPDAWGAQRFPCVITVEWAEARAPSALQVSWLDEQGQPHRALWVVNVADPSQLPPPSELGSLTLEELLQVLTSARPLHQSVARVLDERERRSAASLDTVLDPHKKVDTRNFLLRRVRRVSQALEGLRERLERPAWSIEALRWRLHGPVGPLRLARQLAEGEGQGAAFMIAEVALTLKHTDFRVIEAALGRATVRAERDAVLRELEAQASACGAPDNLATYVRTCFEEVRS